MIALLLHTLAFLAPQETKAFASRSGDSQLDVEAMDDGTFQLVQRGPASQGWTKTVRHSVAGAFVGDSGVVIAHGQCETDTSWMGKGFVLTILRGDELRLVELHPYQTALSHAGPFPAVRGLLVWEELDTCAFWIDDFGKPDQLWTYTLSNGARKGVIEPEQALAKALHVDDWRLCRMRAAIAPGGNDVLLATFCREGPLRGDPGPGNYAGPDLHGIAGLFEADGDLLWHRELPDGQILREIQQVVSSRDSLSCEIEVTRFETVRQRRVQTLVEMLPLRFRRDAAGAWRED